MINLDIALFSFFFFFLIFDYFSFLNQISDLENS